MKTRKRKEIKEKETKNANIIKVIEMQLQMKVWKESNDSNGRNNNKKEGNALFQFVVC